jgi:hypothetical protein
MYNIIGRGGRKMRRIKGTSSASASSPMGIKCCASRKNRSGKEQQRDLNDNRRYTGSLMTMQLDHTPPKAAHTHPGVYYI